MRRCGERARMWLFVLACVGPGLAGWSAVLLAQAPPSDQQILVGLEREWNDAVYRRDAALVDRLLDDDFVATYDDGSRGDKRREVALVRDFNQQVDSADQSDFVVREYGDTAVVWFTLRLVGPKQGVRTEVVLRYTDVWVLRDGQWRCVSAHSTKVREP